MHCKYASPQYDKLSLHYNPVTYALTKTLNFVRKSNWQNFHHLRIEIIQTYMTTFLLVLTEQILHLTKQLIIIPETLMIQYSNKYTN